MSKSTVVTICTLIYIMERTVGFIGDVFLVLYMVLCICSLAFSLSELPTLDSGSPFPRFLSGTYTFGDRTTSDIIVRLRNRESRPEWFYCHSSILSRKSKFFAEQLSKNHSTRLSLHSDNFIEIHCADSTYDHYVKLLSLFYLSQDLVLESWESVRTALGVLQAAIALGCEEITESCIKYLESVPWEDKEEEQLVKIVSTLGEVAMPILARVQPVDLNATKKVFISAIQFATSTNNSCPPFGDELKTSAQEQIEYMLVEDDDTALVTADEEVKSEVQAGLSKMFSLFEIQLGKLSSLSDSLLEAMEKEVIQRLMDLDWICNILTKIGMMKEFVISWTNISLTILSIVQNEKFCSGIWGLKLKVVEVTGKVLDAVGYGNVILPATSRSELLKTWLPFIRMVKPLLDTKAGEDESFEHKLDDELSQNIEHSIISLVLALPSNDQAEILLDWMKGDQVRYPDLSEAFEVWCYRTKAAKRRLMLGFSDVTVGNATVSLE